MLWIGITIFLLLLWLVLKIGDCNGGVIGGVGFLAIVCLTVVGPATLAMTGVVIHYQTELVKVGRNLEIAKEQYETQLVTITSLAAKYPIEEELLRDLNPEILLNLPEIKSDIFLIAQINLGLI